jgi:hypothetical protein
MITLVLERVSQTLARQPNVAVSDVTERSGLSQTTVKNSCYLNVPLALGRIHFTQWGGACNCPVSLKARFSGMMRRARNVC